MLRVDLDFQRYVERRKGARDAQSREGAAYAYAGDLKLLRNLERLKPVRLALESAGRVWKTEARAAFLDGASKVSPRERPAVHALAMRAAELLHVAPPTVYLGAVDQSGGVHTFGSNDEAVVVISRALADGMTEPELTDVLGRECGHIQNNHVGFSTSLYHLEHYANRFLRWIVSPALLALRSWSRRADITGDRAGLLCTRDLGVSEASLRKLGASEARIEALRLFAESAYYRGVVGLDGGLPAAECDLKVAELLSR